MFKTIKKALKEFFKGPITLEYPKEPSLPPTGFRGEFRWLKEKCTNCGLCVKNCPCKALRLENKKIELISERCIHCARCEEVCPTEAIKISSKPIKCA